MKNIKINVKDIQCVIREYELESNNNDYEAPYFRLGSTINFNNKQFAEFIKNIEKGRGELIPYIIKGCVCDELQIKNSNDISDVYFNKVSIYVDGEIDGVLQLLVSAEVSAKVKEQNKWKFKEVAIKEIKEHWGGTEIRNDLIKEMEQLVNKTIETKELKSRKVWSEFNKIESNYVDRDAELGGIIYSDTPVLCKKIIDKFSNILEEVFDEIRLENKNKTKRKNKSVTL